MPLNEDDGINERSDNIVAADTPPHVDSPAHSARVGIGRLEVKGGGHARRRVRIASVGQEDALSDEYLMDGGGGFTLRFRETIKIGRTDFQIILWPPYPALRSPVWTVYHVPAPKIKSPADNEWVAHPIVRIAGSGAASLSEAEVYLGTSPNEKIIGKGDVDADGNWTVFANLATYEPPAGKLTFYVDYFRTDLPKSDRAPLTLNFLSPPTVTSPQNGAVVTDRRPEIAGTGQSGATLSILEMGVDLGYGQFAVSAQGHWRGRLTRDLPDRPILLDVIQHLGGASSSLFDGLKLTYLGAPVITCPPANQTEILPLIIKGSGGIDNARIEIFRDLSSGPVLGWALASQGSWMVQITAMDPGPVSLVAEQVFNNVRSARSAACRYKIVPPTLFDITVERPTSTTTKFSGDGHSGATVQITVVSGPAATPPPPVVVIGGKWQTTSVNWPFGSYTLSAVQKVSDNANGWIESLPKIFTVNSVFPAPSAITHTQVYTPTFSGKGVSGATVKILAAAGGTPLAPDALVRNDQWSSTASAQWGPVFEREIRVQQHLAGQSSEAVAYKVSIPPLAPIVQPPVEADQSPHISGTCWPGAAVTLEYNNDGVKHRPTVTGGTWTFRREAPFAVGVTHTFSVTQTFASQTSVPATGSFTVRRAMLKPGITVPAEGAEVSRNTTVSGELGMEGATMRVWDEQYETMLNSKTLTSDGDWSIELTDLRYGKLSLTAQQTLENDSSQRSEIRVCQVVLKPPVLLVPSEGGHLPRQSTVSGTGWPGARVNAWLVGVDEPLLREVLVSASGQWSGQVTLPQVGYYKMRLQQTSDSETSKDLLCDFQVVPSSPVIESPTQSAAIGGAVVVSGFGFPGDTVTVKLSTGTTLGSVQVLEDRTWSLSAGIDHSGGPSALTVQASCGEFVSAVSDPRPVQINTWLPHIEEPSAGRWVVAPVTFAGTGKAGVGQVVSWFNPDVVWADDLAVSDGQWRGEAMTALAPRGNWYRFRQSFAPGADPALGSDWAVSPRFEVLPPGQSS